MIKNVCGIDIGSANGSIPIRCFGGERLLPDEAARRQLELMASLPGVDEHVVVLPDVHYKSRNPTPTGTVLVSREFLVPRAVDQGINCGMRSMATSIPVSSLTPKLIDGLYHSIIDAIPLKKYDDPLVSDEACLDVLAHGLSRLDGPIDLSPDELERTESGGRMDWGLDPDRIRAAVPAKAIKKGLRTLGTIGAGNHFLELQEIVEVLDEDLARVLGLEAGNAVFMLHTDSRRLGKKILEPLREEGEARYKDGHDLWSVPVDSDLGRRYICGLAAAMHAGFANRTVVTQILREKLRAVLGDEGLELRLLYDCGHESILPEEHNGETLWVHRHGASRAVPADRLGDDPVLRDIGQPVPIPGSMGTDSYLAVAQPASARTFHSVAHGAGRVMEKVDAADAYEEDQVEGEMAAAGIRLYRYHADDIGGQAPASFKNVNHVVEAMTDLDLIRKVVRLRPVAVLKG